VADVDVKKLVQFHRQQGKPATVTAVQPPGRYGALDMEGEAVRGFLEKPQGEGGWINGGFFVLSPKVIDLIADDSTSWELEPMQQLASNRNMVAFEHAGFWQPMDTLREKIYLDELWNSGKAPWKTWE